MEPRCGTVYCKTDIFWGISLTSYLAVSAAVIPHQLDQCDGAEHRTVRVSMAHDNYRHHLVTRPPE